MDETLNYGQSGSSSRHYFDHNATTPLAPEVASALVPVLQDWGNPSSIHDSGRRPKQLLREARQILAEKLNASSLELVFTSGGSEANSTVFQTFFSILLNSKKSSDTRHEIIISAVEHPSVVKAARHLESVGAKLHMVKVGRDGKLDIDQYKSLLSEKTLLVSIMMVNNETGNVFPIRKLCELAHQVGAYFHCDAVQGLGKVQIDLKSMNVDYASFSAHKFYSLKGTGLLYQKRGAPLSSLIFGGAQERQRRGGTENVLGIHGFRLMAEKLALVSENAARLELLRAEFEQLVLSEISGSRITGLGGFRVANTSSLVLDGVDGETLLMNLDLLGFSVSTGAACSSGNPEPSPVLLAMGLSRAEAQNSLRVSMGWGTTREEMLALVKAIKISVERLRRIASEVQL